MKSFIDPGVKVKTFIILVAVVTVVVALTVCGGAYAFSDAAGVLRSFGDKTSWMSSCFVVGDGSWVVAPVSAVTEKVGPEAERTVSNPIFISTYTGRAYPAELKALNKDLGVALVKLPISGLPAAAFARIDEFSKAAYGSMGELMQGEPIGNRWPTDVYGIAREQTKEGSSKLTLNEWGAGKVFVTDIGKFKWLFLSDITPSKAVPDGSMIIRSGKLAGMYLNKLVITGGKEDVVFGRCAMSTEIEKYISDKGVQNAYDPPEPTVTRPTQAEAAFQLQAGVYSYAGVGRADLALDSAKKLVQIAPDDAQARMMLGASLAASGKFDEALPEFAEAEKLNPKLPLLRMNRALALIGLNKKNEAETELLKAISEAPRDSRPLVAIAEFYMADQANKDKAAEYAQKAAVADPNSPAIMLLVARAEKNRKQYAAAVNEIGKALKISPNWGEAYYALGVTYEEAGDIANAEKAYRLYIEKQPNNPEALFILASFLIDQGKKDEPAELIAKIKAMNPPQPVIDAAAELEKKMGAR